MPASSVNDRARAGGAALVDVDGWTVAADFGDACEEYDALRDDAALVDLAFRQRVVATGEDRVAFLQGMLSNDVKSLASGDGCAALLLSEQGKIVADLLVFVTADAMDLEANASGVAAAVPALERFIVADDVELRGDSGHHVFGLFGPRAAELLTSLGVGDLPPRDYAHGVHDVADVPTRVARVPTPAGAGFHCLVAEDAAPRWWASCRDRGARVAGHRAFDTWRIENGVPFYGRDMGPETLALEAPLDHAISFKKGCYLGQEVVERVSARGHVNRKLVGLEIAGDAVASAGERLSVADRDIGWITSACWSWRLGRSVALGFVRREYWSPGTALSLRSSAGETPVTVRALPLV